MESVLETIRTVGLIVLTFMVLLLLIVWHVAKERFQGRGAHHGHQLGKRRKCKGRTWRRFWRRCWCRYCAPRNYRGEFARSPRLAPAYHRMVREQLGPVDAVPQAPGIRGDASPEADEPASETRPDVPTAPAAVPFVHGGGSLVAWTSYPE